MTGDSCAATRGRSVCIWTAVADSVIVRGGGDRIAVRVIAGADGTVIMDSAAAGAASTRIYDGGHPVRIIDGHHVSEDDTPVDGAARGRDRGRRSATRVELWAGAERRGQLQCRVRARSLPHL